MSHQPGLLFLPLLTFITWNFHQCRYTHLPSSVGTPVPGNPSLGKASLHWKIQKPRCIPTSKPSYPYLKTIISIIVCSWKSMDTIGYQCPTMALLLKALPIYCYLFQFLLLLLLMLVVSFNHSIGHAHAFLYQAHNFHYI